jgi:hypothetical protein
MGMQRNPPKHTWTGFMSQECQAIIRNDVDAEDTESIHAMPCGSAKLGMVHLKVYMLANKAS